MMSEETKQAAIVCGLVAVIAVCVTAYHVAKLFVPSAVN